jgi:hypothetical protein
MNDLDEFAEIALAIFVALTLLIWLNLQSCGSGGSRRLLRVAATGPWRGLNHKCNPLSLRSLPILSRAVQTLVSVRGRRLRALS